MAPRVFNPVAVLAALERNDVSYVVIGGVAANVHGSTRVTRDLDIAPHNGRANLDKLANALHELDALIYINESVDPVPFPFDGASLVRAEIWNLITSGGRLDILLAPPGAPPLDEMLGSAAYEELADGLVVAIASIDDLIAMKLAAGRDRDRQDIRDLRRIQELTDEQG